MPSWDPKFFCLDQQTGKKIWTLDLKEFKSGCGSGFEESPVLRGDKLYAVHRDEGFFIIDKNTGEVLENNEAFGDIVDNIMPYGDDHLLFMDTDNLYAFSISQNKVAKTLPLPFKMRTGIDIKGDYLVATQDVKWQDSPYEKGVITLDLKEVLGN